MYEHASIGVLYFLLMAYVAPLLAHLNPYSWGGRFLFEQSPFFDNTIIHVSIIMDGHNNSKKKSQPNVKGEPVFSVMASNWFCEKSGWIGKMEDVKPMF